MSSITLLSSAQDTGGVGSISHPRLPYTSAVVFGVLSSSSEKKFRDRWYGQTNVSYSKTRHAGLDEILRPGTYDYPVILNAVGGYQLTRKWDLSTRFVYLSSKPYTPFNEFLSRQQNRRILDLTRVNGVRASLPKPRGIES